MIPWKRDLRRPALEARLRSANSRRLTTLTAGPGFGKTTLLSQAFDSGAVVWHTVTSADNSPSAFALNLIRKFGLRVPALAPDLRSALEAPTGPDSADDQTRVEALAAAIAGELENRLSRDLVVVLDDVHRLQGPSAQFLGSLCRNASARLHIVTASRDDLPFPIARLRIAGETDELTSSDLAFSRSDLDHLTAGLGLTSTEVDNLMNRTGGWPAAVAIALRTDATPDRERSDLILEYLSQELFTSPETLQALSKVGQLPWVSVDLLSALNLYGPDLDPLGFNRDHFFLTRQPDAPGLAVVAPLIAEFIQSHSTLSTSDRTETLTMAAKWYDAHGHLGEALLCHSSAGEPSEISEFIGRRGETMLSEGMARQLLAAIAALPSEFRSDRILLVEAEARQILGDWEGAAEVYRRLVPESAPMPPAVAWRLGFLQHMRGNVNGALESYQRGELGTDDIAGEATLLGWTASAHWLRGDRDQAKDLADTALNLATLAGDSRALATAHTVLAMVAALDGDRTSNDIHYLRALEHAEKAGDVLQTIRIRSNRGSRFLEEGDLGAALEELNIALRLADMTGFEMWRGMVLSNRAQIASLEGRLEEAIGDLRQARSIFRAIGSSLEAYPMAHLGVVYGLRGDTALATASFEESIRIADIHSDMQALVQALSGLASLIASEDPRRARELASRAVSLHSVIGRVTSLLALSEAALAEGDREEASRYNIEAIDIAKSRNDLAGLASALEMGARLSEDARGAGDLLRQAKQVWTDIGSPIGVARTEIQLAEATRGSAAVALVSRAGETLARLGAKGLALRASHLAGTLSANQEAPVAIRTLGGFEVFVQGDRVPASAWQSRVAREILAMLIANRFRPIHREILVERLWPDEEAAKSGNRLSVALATIRRVLDPGQEDLEPIRSDRDVVGLNADVVSVDVESFLADATEGRNLLRAGDEAHGVALLATAEARYVGDFLEDQPYAEWAIALREEARSMYVDITSTLAHNDVVRGDFDAAARRYLRILERDSYDETAHLALVRVMSLSGRHGSARRLYSIYVERMKDLDVEPQSFPT